MKEVRIKSVLLFYLNLYFGYRNSIVSQPILSKTYSACIHYRCSRLREFFYQILFFLLFFFAKIDMRALFFEDDFDSVQFRVRDLIFK